MLYFYSNQKIDELQIWVSCLFWYFQFSLNLLHCYIFTGKSTEKQDLQMNIGESGKLWWKTHSYFLINWKRFYKYIFHSDFLKNYFSYQEIVLNYKNFS